jgi:hypothetical protein
VLFHRCGAGSGRGMVQYPRGVPRDRAATRQKEFAMTRNTHSDKAAGSAIARLAVAQYLLFDATIESLSVLGENVARLRARAAGATQDDDDAFSASELTEPFVARYQVFRRLP